MICWLLPTAIPFKSYCQSREHSGMPTTARNPNLFLLSLGAEFCPPRGPAPARSHILQGPVLYTCLLEGSSIFRTIGCGSMLKNDCLPICILECISNKLRGIGGRITTGSNTVDMLLFE
jgi:hypothetical protein